MGDGRWIMDGGWWMVEDGSQEVEKTCFSEINIPNIIQYFFPNVSRPLRRLFKTSFVKNTKKLTDFKYFIKFHTMFYLLILRVI